jgi:hypothetical protein
MRVAGGPADLLKTFETNETSTAVAERLSLKRSLQQRSEAVCNHLERMIKACEDKSAVRQTLTIKRALYNLRPANPVLLGTLTQYMEPSALASVLAFNNEVEKLASFEAEIRDAYTREMDATGAHLPEIWTTQRNLRDAISYTHPMLYRDFEFMSVGSPMKAKEKRKLEDTFVQYVTRYASKTSPLSSFTVTHVGQWKSDCSFKLDYSPDLQKHVQLKGALLRQITAPLLSDYRTSSKLFELRINPSARFVNGRIRFRKVETGNVAGGRYWGTGESISELNTNGLIECIRHVFAKRGAAATSAGALIAEVCSLAPKLQADAVERFIEKLYRLQFLLPETHLHEQTDMLAWLMQLIEGSTEESWRTVHRQLQAIQTTLAAFGHATPSDRATLTGQLRDDVSALRTAMFTDDQPAMAGPMFFENCYLGDPVGTLGPALLAPFADELHILLSLSPLVSLAQKARCDLADFFVATFGEEGVCTDVVDFIDQYDELYGLGNMSHVPDQAKLAPTSPVSARYVDAQIAFEEYLAPLLEHGDDVQLDADVLRALADAVPEQIRRRGSSQSYLGQFSQEGGKRKFVLNQVLGGRSALMSRFLEVVDPQSLVEVSDYLRNSSNSGYVAELPGVFGFNANHHPKLCDREIVIPPFPPNWDQSTKLDIRELRLVYDKREHIARFQTSDGQDLDIWYQGFLLPMLLPRVQRVLALAYTEGVNFFMLGALTKGTILPKSVTTIPRISLGDIVVARRTWIVPTNCQPNGSASAQEFFMEVQAWREQHGIPSEVFMRVMPIPASMGGGSESSDDVKWGEFDYKNLKPTYVRLDSPRLVRLMQRMIKRNHFSLVLSEVLPQLHDQHVELSGRGHVAELQFELSNIPPRLQQATPAAHWHAIRIAYFDEDRRSLILGPLQEAMVQVRRQFGVERMMVIPHWKHGPHIDLVVHCPEIELHERILPVVRAELEPWLAAHPSTVSLDPLAYEALSQKIAMTELEPGPYLPLLDNNRITLAPYEPSRALKLPALARSKERFLCSSLDLTLRLLDAKRSDSDAFLLTLVAMMAMAAQTYEAGGFARGYVSYRSHAEYYFASYDRNHTLRGRFDLLDARLGKQVDQVLHAVLEDQIGELPLSPALQAVLNDWKSCINRTAIDNRRIVDENYEALRNDTTFERLAEAVSNQTPMEFQLAMRNREMSGIGKAFQSDEGLRVMNSAQFMSYRSNVNFFYLLLPILGVSPTQKFCLCHLLANGAERVLHISWREIMGLAEGPEMEAGA